MSISESPEWLGQSEARKTSDSVQGLWDNELGWWRQSREAAVGEMTVGEHYTL